MNERLMQPGTPDLSPAPPARRSRVGRSDFNEADAVEQFLKIAPNLRCCGERWFAYEDGVWDEGRSTKFGKTALMVMSDDVRTARRATSILNHVEYLQQFPIEDLNGFYRQDGGVIFLNCQNGVARVDGSDSELLPHAKEYGFTLKSSARFDPSARCPLFLSTLAASLPDEEDRKLFHMFAGSLLIPDCRFETSLIGYGVAGSGKSTLADTVAAALGESLVTRISMRQLTDEKGYHLNKLRFAALNLAMEVDSVGSNDGGVFKALVSGEKIQIRPIYDDSTVMRSTAKLMFLANTLPKFEDGTDGETRRLRFIRFENKPTVEDTTLKQRLLAEIDGVFLWMVTGMVTLLQAGRMPRGSNRSQSTLTRFEVSNDPIGSFIKSRCELCPTCETEKDALLSAYKEYLAENGLPSQLESTFFRKLYERFPGVSATRRRTATGRAQVVLGIRIIQHDEDL